MNINELNYRIKNLFRKYTIENIKEAASEKVKEWMIDNVSLVGRYSYKDGERFGNYWTIEDDLDHYDRQDGWVALTEEVSDVDGTHFGTGMLYIHGEMELPKYTEYPGDNIRGDEYGQSDAEGRPRIKDDALNCFKMVQFQDTGYLQEGYVYEWEEQDHQREDGKWPLEYVAENVGGFWHADAQPPGINRLEHAYSPLATELNLFPWVVVMSTRPRTIKDFLTDWEGTTGPYGNVVTLAEPSYPPKFYSGIKYEKGEIDGIVDFLSPLQEVPKDR